MAQRANVWNERVLLVTSPARFTIPTYDRCSSIGKSSRRGFELRGMIPYRFEVICAACGDIDGPLEYQPVAAQQLRGPFESKRIAEKVAQRHHVGSTFAVKRDGAAKRRAAEVHVADSMDVTKAFAASPLHADDARTW